MLLEAGADKERPNHFGQTPLWVARRTGNAGIMHALLKASAEEKLDVAKDMKPSLKSCVGSPQLDKPCRIG